MENIPQSHSNQSSSLKKIQECGYIEPRISFYKLDVLEKTTADAVGITTVLVIGWSVYRARQEVSLFVTTFWHVTLYKTNSLPGQVLVVKSEIG